MARTATVDGYPVSLAADLVPGQASKLTLSVSKDGRPVIWPTCTFVVGQSLDDE
ncbi:hypothetical protein AB0392_07240 [Nonomuraea angiospora]|uniref:hypothetical protein n=1 Tax=Nonomuraea angiospora TaxID=46172 RepID=UPI0034501D12